MKIQKVVNVGIPKFIIVIKMNLISLTTMMACTEALVGPRTKCSHSNYDDDGGGGGGGINQSYFWIDPDSELNALHTYVNSSSQQLLIFPLRNYEFENVIYPSSQS